MWVSDSAGSYATECNDLTIVKVCAHLSIPEIAFRPSSGFLQKFAQSFEKHKGKQTS
jgi:hypothetical protein